MRLSNSKKERKTLKKKGKNLKYREKDLLDIVITRLQGSRKGLK